MTFDSDTMTRQHSANAAPSLLDQLEALCQKRGVRLTPLRRNVFSIFAKSKQSLKAYDIIRTMSTPQHKVKPPIVYRTLDFFLEQGIIHRIDSDNSFVLCRHPQKRHHCMLVVCEDCHAVDEFCDESLSRIIQLNVHNTGFEMLADTLEVKGLCPTCVKKRKTK